MPGNMTNEAVRKVALGTAHAARWACWLRIALSPAIGGVSCGALVYAGIGNKFGATLGALIAVTGVTCGIAWAEHVRRKYTTVHFMSRIYATPELDVPFGPEQCPVCGTRMLRIGVGTCAECRVDLSRAVRRRKAQ